MTTETTSNILTNINPNKIYVFTDIDLDGATSLLALHWITGAKPGEISFETSTINEIRKKLLVWLEKHSFLNYEHVVFLDLDTSSVADLIDHKKTIIIDHHRSHVEVKETYKQATTRIIETTSCAKLIYALARKENTNLTLLDSQRHLIALADDYDCYKFALSNTFDLNCLFTNTQKTLDQTRTHKFVNRWYNGFDLFNRQELNIINEYKKGMEKAISELQVYEGTVNIGHKPTRIMGTTGTRFVNDVCEYLLQKLGADVAFFVNPNNSHVSFRKKKECTVDMSQLAAKLCEGGGHEYAAGGKTTETFMEFVKQLTPYKI